MSNKLSITAAIKLASNLSDTQKNRALAALRRLWHNKCYDKENTLGLPLQLQAKSIVSELFVLNFNWHLTKEGWAFWYLIEAALEREFGYSQINNAIHYERSTVLSN